MPKSRHIKGPDDQFAAQLRTFRDNIGSYAATVGVTPAQVTAQAADAAYFAYAIACQQTAQNTAQQWTSWKDLIRAGGTPPPEGMPQPPAFPTAVAEVAPGVEPRFRALVKQIKAHQSYNESIGEALGIEGAEQSGPDFAALRPVIDVAISGARVEVEWGWQGQRAFLDACEIEVDRGTGWTLLAQDTTPGYVDTHPFPATPTRWNYRAIYRVDDTRVGQWSQEAGLTVG